MNKGYDTEAFIVFMDNLKYNGSNVDSWNFPELKAAVRKF